MESSGGVVARRAFGGIGGASTGLAAINGSGSPQRIRRTAGGAAESARGRLEQSPLAPARPRGERPASESDAKKGRESAGRTPANPIPAALQPLGKNVGTQNELNQRLAALTALADSGDRSARRINDFNSR